MRRPARAPSLPSETPRAPERALWSPSAELDTGAVESPARRLQLHVEATLAPAQDKWSGRQTAAFLLLTNGLFWIGLVWTVRALI